MRTLTRQTGMLVGGVVGHEAQKDLRTRSSTERVPGDGRVGDPVGQERELVEVLRHKFLPLHAVRQSYRVAVGPKPSLPPSRRAVAGFLSGGGHFVPGFVHGFVSASPVGASSPTPAKAARTG